MGVPVLRLSCVSSLFALALSGQVLAATGPFPTVFPLAGVDGTTGFKVPGLGANDRSGSPLQGAGDINQDGIDDFMIAAPGEGASAAGKVYVVFGKAGGLPATVDLAALDGSNGFVIEDGIAGSGFGLSIAPAGDMNHDGYDDIVIGAPNTAIDGISQRGAAYVVYGRFDPSARFNVASLDGANGYRIIGMKQATLLGQRVARAGDLNNDGFDDIVMTAPGDEMIGDFIAYGRSGVRDATVQAVGFSATAGEGGYVYCLSTAHNCGDVGGVGDFNGDGYDDLYVGLRDTPSATSQHNEFLIIFGKAGTAPTFGVDYRYGYVFKLSQLSNMQAYTPTVTAAGDVNGDGFADFIAGVPAINWSAVVFGSAYPHPQPDWMYVDERYGTDGFVIAGHEGVDAAGVASAVGDMNGDGFNDIVVGGDSQRSGATIGASVIFGKATGFDAAFDLQTLNGLNGFHLSLPRFDSTPMVALAGAGDVNHDGFADVLVGLNAAAPGAVANAGESYVVYGHSTVTSLVIKGTDQNDKLVGGDYGDRIYAYGGPDILEGKGGGDRLDGGDGWDMATYLHATSGVVADLASPGNNTGEAAGDTYYSIEKVRGSEFSDTLRGSTARNTLTGGRGADRLTGGLGTDLFVIASVRDSPAGAGRDRIMDFQAGTSGTVIDRIDLSQVDAATSVAGNQAFTFIGTQPFSHQRGQLRLKVSAHDVIVQGDVNGDAVADLEVLLAGFTNVQGVTASDFRP